jgi:formate dehydrogenase iron-sulfur subunit
MESGSEDLVRLTLDESVAGVVTASPLIPDRPLEPGEQYRFHFDMTKCIGCRSCEVACNEQNGNPAEIKWRRLGELEGGTYPDTHRSYLSMGCNHCLSPDCLSGCPVNAYTKDPVTGIVLHSADACIGCQYCVWNCPYSVPQFNPERGVVGKCDMCRGRLLDGREPACVGACPENAISIEIVNTEEWRRDFAQADSPGMPAAGQTISTTRITLPQESSTWLERVDTGAIQQEHSHPSLIILTCAMQAVFGALAALYFSHALGAVSATLLLMLTAGALTVSVFHLGRPAYAWRAARMWRHSWLSREVVLFGLFFASVALTAISDWVSLLGFRSIRFALPIAEVAAVILGLSGTVASAFVYRVKARPAWNMAHTPLDFLFSSAMMGIALAAAMQLPVSLIGGAISRHGIQASGTHAHVDAVFQLIACGAWISNQLTRLLRLKRSSNFESRATYNLLRSQSLWWGTICSISAAALAAVLAYAGLSTGALIAAITAAVLGRYLFFVSVVPVSMALTFLNTPRAHGAAA